MIRIYMANNMLITECGGNRLMFYGRIENIIIRKSGGILQKKFNSIGRSVFVQNLQFDVPIIDNIDALL